MIDSGRPLGSVSLASSAEPAIVSEPFSPTAKPPSFVATGGCNDPAFGL
jgi:hypothetical protein